MNENVLMGIRCPKCQGEDEFKVRATAWLTVIDNGIEHVETTEWDDDSAAECGACGFAAPWGAFAITPHLP